MPDPFDAEALAREWLGPFYAEVEWDLSDDRRALAALLTRVRREALEEAAGVIEAKRAVSEGVRQRTSTDSIKTWNYYNVRCVAFGEAAHDIRALIPGRAARGWDFEPEPADLACLPDPPGEHRERVDAGE